MKQLENFIKECKNDWETQPKKKVHGAIASNVSKYMYSLERLIKPMKPKVYSINKKEIHFDCPICHYDRYYQRGRIRFPNHCEDCGQKLDWEKTK